MFEIVMGCVGVCITIVVIAFTVMAVVFVVDCVKEIISEWREENE